MMDVDLISLLLAAIVVLVFMAIFTLLRTMNSPFFYRFASILNGTVEPIAPDGSYRIAVEISGRRVELLSLFHATDKNKDKSRSQFLFLRVQLRSQNVLRFRDVLSEKRFKYMMDEIFGAPHEQSYLKPYARKMPAMLNELSALTDDETVAERFLSTERVPQWLSIFREDFGMGGVVIPLVFESGWLTLDYSLTQRFLTDIADNPRHVHRHADRLMELADAFERTSQPGN
jgi:hypothetical protein